MRAELSGTNTAPGVVHGVPIVRTPGDELPERPEFVAGLRRPSQEGQEEALEDTNGADETDKQARTKAPEVHDVQTDSDKKQEGQGEGTQKS